MNLTIIDALVEYFRNCPLMTGFGLNVDWLPEKPNKKGAEYAIAAVPADDVVYSYLGGGARCRYPFIVSSVNNYGQDEAQNVLNSGFYEQLAAWIQQQNRKRRLPDLPAGMQPLKIRAIGHGYLYQPDVDAGKYQIQCELEYYRKGA